MGSIYDRTSNIYSSKFRAITLNNSGYFKLPDEPAKVVTVHNIQIQTDAHDYDIKIAKVDSPSSDGVLNTPETNLFNYPWGGCDDMYSAGNNYCDTSGTAYVTGYHLPLQEGMSFEVRGVGNANQVAIAKGYHLDPTMMIYYVVEK